MQWLYIQLHLIITGDSGPPAMKIPRVEFAHTPASTSSGRQSHTSAPNCVAFPVDDMVHATLGIV